MLNKALQTRRLIWKCCLAWASQCMLLLVPQVSTLLAGLRATWSKAWPNLGSRPILVTSGEVWYLPYCNTEETRTAMP